jgi:hypothetical protein
LGRTYLFLISKVLSSKLQDGVCLGSPKVLSSKLQGGVCLGSPKVLSSKLQVGFCSLRFRNKIPSWDLGLSYLELPTWGLELSYLALPTWSFAIKKEYLQL